MLEDTKPLLKSQAINLSRGRKPVHGSGGPWALRSAQDRLCRHPAELLATGAGAQSCQVPVLSGISSYRYSGYLTHQVHKVELFSHNHGAFCFKKGSAFIILASQKTKQKYRDEKRCTDLDLSVPKDSTDCPG